MKKYQIILLSILSILLLIQFIPVEMSNPQEHTEPAWDSPTTKDYFYRACADCHSNRVKFPFYTKIAPFSWLIAHDINEGREKFNISNGNLKDADEAGREVRKEAMPILPYKLLHPEARLSDVEIAEFAKGLEATFGKADEQMHNDKFSR